MPVTYRGDLEQPFAVRTLRNTHPSERGNQIQGQTRSAIGLVLARSGTQDLLGPEEAMSYLRSFQLHEAVIKSHWLTHGGRMKPSCGARPERQTHRSEMFIQGACFSSLHGSTPSYASEGKASAQVSSHFSGTLHSKTHFIKRGVKHNVMLLQRNNQHQSSVTNHTDHASLPVTALPVALDSDYTLLL